MCVFPTNDGKKNRREGHNMGLFWALSEGHPKWWRGPSSKKLDMRLDQGMRKESQVTTCNIDEFALVKGIAGERGQEFLKSSWMYPPSLHREP